MEEVQIALGKSLSKVAIGNPTTEGVRMGALASKDQVQEVRDRVKELAKTAEIVYGSLDKIDLIDADFEKGAFLSPVLLLEKNPYKNLGVHEIEAFGPVSTLMPIIIWKKPSNWRKWVKAPFAHPLPRLMTRPPGSL